MTTDSDLDVRLSAAGGVRSDELPPLPEAFLAHLRDDRSGTGPVLRPHAVPSPTAAEPARVLAARQLVADAHARRHRPSSAAAAP